MSHGVQYCTQIIGSMLAPFQKTMFPVNGWAIKLVPNLSFTDEFLSQVAKVT
jgi:hypothetical protein